MKMNAPAPWARDAATLPLAFAQVREDPRLDIELCAALPADPTVVMIASGGDTAACLARLPLSRLVLVDMNAAQLALTRCKLHLAQNDTRDDALRWLGHAPMPPGKRSAHITATLAALGLPADALGSLERVAGLGPDFAGRYEACFAQLRATLAPQADEMRRFFEADSNASAMLAPETPLGRAMDAAFADVMSLPNLVTLFGQDATQNPRKPFAHHFAGRIRDAATRFVPRTNPFLWQIVAGKFPPGVTWDWLTPEAWLQRPRIEPEFIQAPMLDTLASLPASSCDLVHLSNILDWLSAAAAARLLAATHRALKPGGTVVIRQLNSTLEIPALESALRWDTGAGRDATSRDRSFFYPLIHIGHRP